MIRDITIQNFKSVSDVKLSLGRINVLIGENGCGKSNILEGIALASAAYRERIEHEFLASRGIRIGEARSVISAFDSRDAPLIEVGVGDLLITVRAGEQRLELAGGVFPLYAEMDAVIEEYERTEGLPEKSETRRKAVRALGDANRREIEAHPLSHFLIYSPENTALRNFYREGQILPLGIKGEGLFAHLRKLDPELIVKIGEHLKLIDWFDGFDIPTDLGPGERRLNIRDRYLSEGGILDQRSANEGFLFLLFYFTLFVSPKTPEFFAVDNIDASLNPKLCRRLMQGRQLQLSQLLRQRALDELHD